MTALNTFTQAAESTAINGGTIVANHINVTGGTFGGTGKVVGTTALNNATLFVGAGGLNFKGNLTQTGGLVDFDSITTGSSTLAFTGTYSFSGATILFDFAAGTTAPTSFNINSFITANSGAFTGDTFEYEVGTGPIGHLNYNSKTGALVIAAVPEPETYSMLLAGMLLIGAGVRRRKAAVG